MRKMRRMIFAEGLILALSLLAGASAYAAPPCSSLIAPAEAAAALGVSDVKGGTGTTVCQWLPKETTPGPSKSLAISIMDAKGYESYSRLPSIPGRLEITPVSGIGDGAIYQTMQGARAVLMVKKGDNSFSASVGGLPLDQAKAAEQTIAKQVLQKL